MVGFASSFPNHSADDWVREQLGLLWFVCVLKEPSLRGAPSWLAAATWVPPESNLVYSNSISV